jgi:hypothetical protein
VGFVVAVSEILGTDPKDWHVGGKHSNTELRDDTYNCVNILASGKEWRIGVGPKPVTFIYSLSSLPYGKDEANDKMLGINECSVTCTGLCIRVISELLVTHPCNSSTGEAEAGGL